MERNYINKKVNMLFQKMQLPSLSKTITGGIFILSNIALSAENKPYNALEVNLAKLAPYASWTNYYGAIALDRVQEKINSVYCAPADWSITMSGQHDQGDLRGKYEFLMPGQSEKIILTSSFSNVIEGMAHGPVSIGYSAEGCPIEYPLERIKKKSIELDVGKLSGKKSKIFLKSHGVAISGTFTKWDAPKIIAFYPEKGLPDLAISPSDLEIKSIPGKDTVINATIHNISSNALKNEFTVSLFIDGKQVDVKKCSSLSGKSTAKLIWNIFQTKVGKTNIRVEINSQEEENSKGNNIAELTLLFPSYRTIIREIRGYPAPWKTEKLVIDKNQEAMIAGEKYTIVLDILDHSGKKIDVISLPLVSDNSTCEISLPDICRIGWWQIQGKVFCNNILVDSLDAAFCKIPKQTCPSNLESIFNTMSDFWCESEEKELFKDSGASSQRRSIFHEKVLEKYIEKAGKYIQSCINSGVIPYCCVWPQTPEEAKEFGFNLAKRYPHETTKVWWEIWGEGNQRIAPKDYALLVRNFYEGAKAADPNVKIATMEMTHCHPSLLDDGSKGSRYDWLKQLYPQVKGCISAVGNNHYSSLAPEKPFYDAIVGPMIDIIRENGDLGKVQVHLLEGNISGGPDVLVRGYLYQMGKKEEGASIMNWFCLRDYWTPVSSGRNGMVKYNRNPKPTYQAYAVMTSFLKGAEFLGEKDIGKDNYCYFFKKGSEEFACVWNGKNKEQVLTVAFSNTVKITDIMGQTESISAKDGHVSFKISSSPVYVAGLNLSSFSLLACMPFAIGKNSETFEKDYPQVTKLIANGKLGRVYYNIAKRSYLQGKSANEVNKFIENGLAEITATPSDSRDEIKSIYFTKPVKIDGRLTEWADIPVYKGDRFSFQTGWDDRNLYFAFNVEDKNIISDYRSTTASGYGGDCIELFLDTLNQKEKDPVAFKPGFSQHFFGLNNQIGRFKSSDEVMAQMVWEKNEKGYVMELAFAMDYLFLDGISPGHRISFNASIDDTYKAGIENEFRQWRKKDFISHTCSGASDMVFTKREGDLQGKPSSAECYAENDGFSISNGFDSIASNRTLNKELLRINNTTSLLLYYRDMNEPDKKYYISGKELTGCRFIKKMKNENEIRATYLIKEKFQLELDISAKRGQAGFRVDSALKNTATAPYNLGMEWKLGEIYPAYMAVDKKVYGMPQQIVGMDMTQGLMGKFNWQSIGITPYDKWIYLISDDKTGRGIGIVVEANKNQTTFFGIREDKQPYWGEIRKILEEEGIIKSKFWLIPSDSKEKYLDALLKIEN